MPSIPEALVQRLGTELTSALQRALVEIGQTLTSSYREALLDHAESRGDDAQLFGLRVYKYARFRLVAFCAEDPVVTFVEKEGAYCLAVGPLQLRVDVLGHFLDDDVRSCFPDTSPAKRAFGRGNAHQLSFELDNDAKQPDGACFEANLLTAGHFGNAREGLVKWFLGAWSDDANQRKWAWIERQDQPDEVSSSLPVRAQPEPFGQRTAEQFVVRARNSA